MSSVPAIHHPLRNVEASTGEIGVTIHIYHPAHRTAVDAHSNLQAWMRLERATDFNRALRRRFLTGVEDQRHAVAGWNFYQSTRSFCFLVLIRTADHCGQFVNHRPLLVNRQLRVTNNVDEKDMRDFEPNLLFNLGGHVMNLPEIKIIDTSASRRRIETKDSSVEHYPQRRVIFSRKNSHTFI